VIEAPPTASVETVRVAWREPLRVEVPRVAVPLLKVTVPVGVPVPGAVAVTVAVSVTDWPYTDGLTDELTAVEAPSVFTV
jgi:hypothetical protein